MQARKKQGGQMMATFCQGSSPMPLLTFSGSFSHRKAALAPCLTEKNSESLLEGFLAVHVSPFVDIA